MTRNRGQFPSEQAALKVLYLAVRNFEELRRPIASRRVVYEAHCDRFLFKHQ